MTDGRYTIDPALVRPDRGRLLQSFVFQVTIDGRTATLLLRPGFITAEFFDLAGKADRDQAEEAHLDELKSEMAQPDTGGVRRGRLRIGHLVRTAGLLSRLSDC